MFGNKHNKYLEPYIQVMPHIGDIMEEGVCVLVTNTERYIKVQGLQPPGMIIKEGGLIGESDPIRKTLSRNCSSKDAKAISIEGGYELLSFSVQNSAGECIGCVGVITDKNKEACIHKDLEDLQFLYLQ